ncbi:hypothetical protein HPB49_011732 [Dermacentor silvarum]|uniref:Uncharacterized protein n=1 Tax=Dermacentor silvarum TaxID=543639 RepID=A0ACB8CR26_DERSI|nr:hypothetical protein HPB49_011732 [Dermacentor silvarum]
MAKPMRQCKERTCFVPLCRSGYRSNKDRVPLFTAPSDATRLAEWARMIRRTDRKLTPTAVVCEKHFESSLIERAFSITVNGVVHEIPRDKPRLKPDAIPTIFPEYPKHLVPKVPAKRKTRNLCEQDLELPAKRRRRAQSDASELCSAVESDESESLEGCGDHLNTAAPEEFTPRCSSEAASAQNDEAQRLQTTREIRHPFCDLSIPVSWMKVPSPPVESVAYAYCEAEATMRIHSSHAWLMTPVLGHPAINTPERRFNTAHAFTRSPVERCIGVLNSMPATLRRLALRPQKGRNNCGCVWGTPQSVPSCSDKCRWQRFGAGDSGSMNNRLLAWFLAGRRERPTRPRRELFAMRREVLQRPFRMAKRTVRLLCSELAEHLEPQTAGGLSVEDQVL